MMRVEDATIAQFRRDLVTAIAETRAQIQWLEARLAEAKADAARETGEEPAAAAEGEAQE